MNARTCHRRFEVEALRDGRIGGRARASIERHVATCAACKEEERELQEASDALRALPAAEIDAASERRQRQRLIARFNEEQLEAPKLARDRRPLVGAAFAIAIAALAVVWVRGRQRTIPVPQLEQRADDVELVAPESARWSREEQGATTRVRLDDGELEIHVRHRGEAHGLVVTVPDGELQDVGTTFHVQVRDGRTVGILVREGAIVFRRKQGDAVLLGAGQSWTADTPPPALASASAAAPSATPTAPKPRPASSAQPSPGGTTQEFRDAVDRLNAGDSAGAATALRSYLVRHPDVGAEDATYLLVLALHRSGDDAGAAAAARDYLRLYPNGLRRREVEGLAAGTRVHL